MAFSFRSKRADFEITEDRFDIRREFQHLLWNYRIVCIIGDRPRSDSEHSFRPYRPDSKRWSPISIGSPAMNYVARVNHFRIILALAGLAENGNNEQKYRCKRLCSHCVLQQCLHHTADLLGGRRTTPRTWNFSASGGGTGENRRTDDGGNSSIRSGAADYGDVARQGT